jgi:hypothetical protein
MPEGIDKYRNIDTFYRYIDKKVSMLRRFDMAGIGTFSPDIANIGTGRNCSEMVSSLLCDPLRVAILTAEPTGVVTSRRCGCGY